MVKEKEREKEKIKGAKPIGKKIDRGISCLIFSEPGIGKTSTLSTLPVGETLIISVEAGLGPLLGTGHHVIALDQDLKQLQSIYEDIATKEHQYTNICVDNVSELQDWMVVTLTQTRGKDFTEIKEYGDASQKMREYLHLFRDLTYKGMNVWFTAWEMPMPIEEGEDITVTRIYPKLFKKLAPEICGIVDLVGHLEMYEKTGDRFLRFQGGSKMIAKSQYRGIGKFMPANLPHIIEKIKAFDYTEVKPPELVEVNEMNVGKT